MQINFPNSLHLDVEARLHVHMETLSTTYDPRETLLPTKSVFTIDALEPKRTIEHQAQNTTQVVIFQFFC